jgi:hypothetical protein
VSTETDPGWDKWSAALIAAKTEYWRKRSVGASETDALHAAIQIAYGHGISAALKGDE